jgi:hypothetical protein
MFNRGFRAVKKSSSSSLSYTIHEKMKDLKIEKGLFLPVSGRSCFTGEGFKAALA